MRRRVRENSERRPPAHLLCFTASAELFDDPPRWEAAYERWSDGRDAWLAERANPDDDQIGAGLTEFGFPQCPGAEQCQITPRYRGSCQDAPFDGTSV